MGQDKTRPKRNRPENVSEDPTPKVPRISEPLSYTKIMEYLDRCLSKQTEAVMVRMEKHTEELTVQIMNSEENILGQITDLRQNLLDIENKVSTLFSRVAKIEKEILYMDTLKTDLQKLKSVVSRQENNLVSCDLRIFGIPWTENENLLSILDTICMSINIEMPPINDIFRLNNRNKSTKDGVVIAKLFNTFDRSKFLKSLALFRRTNKCNILLKHAGFTSDGKIFINESLTNVNYKILQKAVQYRKEKKLWAAYSVRGIVHIRVADTSGPTKIFSVEELDNLLISSSNQDNNFFPVNNDSAADN